MNREEARHMHALVNSLIGDGLKPRHARQLKVMIDNIFKQPALAGDVETFTLIYIEDDEEVSFVNMVNARLPVVEECFEQISADYSEYFGQGSGEYTIKIGSYNEAQVGEYGRVEIAPWWNMDVIALDPIDTQSKEVKR